MAELIIYLQEEPVWYCEGFDDLSLAAKDKEVIVLLPGEDVSLVRATMPKLSKSKLIQALPFALEEQLIAEVDSLHFVPLFNENEETIVAVTAKEKMQAWLAQLKALHIKPSKLIPVYFALKPNEQQWSVVLYNQSAFVRIGNHKGFGCDRFNLGEILQSELSNCSELPTEIIITNYTHAIAPELSLAVPVNESLLPAENFIQDLSANYANYPDVSLLQGSYAQKKSHRPKMKNLWHIGIAMSAIWVITLLMYPVVSYFILKQKTTEISMQITEIYKRNFPNATSIVAPKMRMEEKLRKAGKQGMQDHFLLSLGNLSAAMSEVPVTLKRLDYQNNQFNLQITAASSDDFTAFTNFLTSKNMTVKQQNASLEGERLNATVVVQ